MSEPLTASITVFLSQLSVSERLGGSQMNVVFSLLPKEATKIFTHTPLMLFISTTTILADSLTLCTCGTFIFSSFDIVSLLVIDDKLSVGMIKANDFNVSAPV